VRQGHSRSVNRVWRSFAGTSETSASTTNAFFTRMSSGPFCVAMKLSSMSDISGIEALAPFQGAGGVDGPETQGIGLGGLSPGLGFGGPLGHAARRTSD